MESDVNTAVTGARMSAFPSTRWSLVIQATAGEGEQVTLALEEICRRYWYPIYAYLRRTGRNREDAEDFTQGFFERLVSKETLANAQSERGKLRTFLLAALKRYLADCHRHQQALKRGGDAQFLVLDYEKADERFTLELADNNSDPETLFERTWARDLFDQARTQLRQTYAESGRAELFDGLEEFLAWNESNRSYRHAAEKLGIDEKNIRSNVYRLRQRYRAAVESLVADTVESQEDVNAEVQNLLRIIS